MTLLTTIKSRSLEEGGFGKLGGIFGVGLKSWERREREKGRGRADARTTFQYLPFLKLGGFLPLKAKAKEV